MPRHIALLVLVMLLFGMTKGAQVLVVLVFFDSVCHRPSAGRPAVHAMRRSALNRAANSAFAVAKIGCSAVRAVRAQRISVLMCLLGSQEPCGGT